MNGRAKVAVLATLVAVAAVPGGPAYGIAGGTAAAEGSYGFVADVKFGDLRGCSGVLVDPEWIATAGTCLAENGQAPAAGPPTQPTTVTVGRTNLLTGTGGQVRTVVDVMPRTDRNLVLLKLASPVADVALAKIGTTAPATGEVLRVAGFGRTATEWVPGQLHTGTLTVQASTTTTVDLTGDAASVCKGDTGGPAFREPASGIEVVALNDLSWQGGCFTETETRKGASEVRLDNIKDWIAQAVRGGDFVRLPTSAHVFDTRTGLGAPAAPQQGGTDLPFQVTGVDGVPATGVRAVLIDVTAISPTAGGYLTVYPEGTTRPVISTVNFGAGQNTSNTAVVTIPASGKLSVYLQSGTANVTVDVQGYYTAPFGTAGGGFVPVEHTRLVDTRTNLGGGGTTMIPSGSNRTFTLTGGVIPAGAAAAFLDVIVVGATGQGWIGAFPPGGTNNRSVMDYLSGTTSHGLAVQLGTDGRVTFTNNSGSAIHLVLTAQGYFTSSRTTGLGLRTAPTTWVLDTRTIGDGDPLEPDAIVDVPLGLPAGTAAVLNLISVHNTSWGYVKAWPVGGTEPTPSLTTYAAPNTSARSGLAVVRVGTGGQVHVKNTSGGTTHLLVQLQAWYGPALS